MFSPATPGAGAATPGVVEVATATQYGVRAPGTGPGRVPLRAPTWRVALWRARDRRRVRACRLRPRRLAQRGGSLGRGPRQESPGVPAPQGVGRTVHRGVRLRPRRPRE